MEIKKIRTMKKLVITHRGNTIYHKWVSCELSGLKENQWYKMIDGGKYHRWYNANPSYLKPFSIQNGIEVYPTYEEFFDDLHDRMLQYGRNKKLKDLLG